MSVSASARSGMVEAVVTRWVDRFNARDLDGMLACLDPDVRFQPLKLNHVRGGYRGHDGVRQWFAQLAPASTGHLIDLDEVQIAADGRALAVGTLCVAGQADIAPFCGLHSVANGLITSARHYLSEPEIIEKLGLAP